MAFPYFVMPVLGTGIHEFVWGAPHLRIETRGWSGQARS
jgi:hypothetical protein